MPLVVAHGSLSSGGASSGPAWPGGRRRLGGCVVEIDVAEIFHGAERRGLCLSHFGAAEVEIGQLRERGKLGEFLAGDVGALQVQGAQVRELFERVEACIGYCGTCQFCLNDVGGKSLKLRQLSVAEGGGSINGVERESI